MTSAVAASPPRSYAFGPFVLVPERQLLLSGGSRVRIGGRALDLLTALVEQPGEIVSKRQLMARAWPKAVVDEGNLKVNMAALRRVLGDQAGAAQYVATVTGRGYRFVAPVRTEALPDPLLPPSEAGVRGHNNHNLPTGVTRIFGRSDAIDAIRRDLQRSRLVSIIGPGGIGKTTVAVSVAERALGMFKDGVWLIDLALLRDPDLVPNVIATAIGVQIHTANTMAALCGFVRDREMLLVLDSCEHLIDAAASCAEQVLAAAGGVKLLVTSREPLLVPGERVRRLTGLGIPPSAPQLNAETALTYPAIQLFVDRATDRLESFTLSDADAPMVADICRNLDGLALAIEFAATRVDAFGVSGLLKQLDHRFSLLVGRRAGPERHRTLMATLDWSYCLLSEKEAELLRAVSVFAGVFDVGGASAVSTLDTSEAAIVLAQLSAKSLLTLDLDADGAAYRLLETTRTYCHERLRVASEDEMVRQRHAEHVCKVLERAAGEWAQRPAPEWGNAYIRTLDDLRGALSWAGRNATNRSLLIRLTVAGTLLWNHFSLTEECRSHVSRAVEELDAAGLAMTATDMKLQLSLAGTTMFARGPVHSARDAMQRAFDIAIQVGDTDYRLRCLRMIGGYELFVGEHEAAVRTLETFASVAAAEEPASLLDGDAHLRLAEIYVGRLQSARTSLESRSGNDARGSNDPRFARFLYDRNVDLGNVLSIVQWLTGSPDTAMRTAAATVELALETRHALSLSNALAVAACPILFLNGHYQEASRYLEMLEDQNTRHGIVMWRPTALFYRGALACVENPASAEGLDDMERAVAEFRAINHWSRIPFFLGMLADASAKGGRLVGASAYIQGALDRSRAQGDRWCVPELLRIRASLLANEGRPGEAETLLLESIAHAMEIGALSWQLRAANDLAQLWLARARPQDAREMLLPIYSQFTEGFETHDLAAARRLLSAAQ